MTIAEKHKLLGMLDRAGIGYGIRQNWDGTTPAGKTVLIEVGDDHDEGEEDGDLVEFDFDEAGRLLAVAAVPGESEDSVRAANTRLIGSICSMVRALRVAEAALIEAGAGEALRGVREAIADATGEAFEGPDRA